MGSGRTEIVGARPAAQGSGSEGEPTGGGIVVQVMHVVSVIDSSGSVSRAYPRIAPWHAARVTVR